MAQSEIASLLFLGTVPAISQSRTTAAAAAFRRFGDGGGVGTRVDRPSL